MIFFYVDRILCWQLLFCISFRTLMFYCFWWEISAHSNCSPLCNMLFVSSKSHDFHFMPGFQHSDYEKPESGFLSIYPTCGLVIVLNLTIYVSPQIWGMVRHYFFHTVTTSPFSSPSGTLIIILDLRILSQMSWRLCYVWKSLFFMFFKFFFC